MRCCRSRYASRVLLRQPFHERTVSLMQSTDKYPFWTFNGQVPGPFIRCRVGDVLEVRHTNKSESGIGHNIDFHAVIGPGGGAPALYAELDETKTGVFKMLYPGLFIYHCAAAPVPMHIANGMYGLILVEPEGVSGSLTLVPPVCAATSCRVCRVWSQSTGSILCCSLKFMLKHLATQ
jgi:hypothetical protein